MSRGGGIAALPRRVLDRLGPGEPEAKLVRDAAEYWSSSAVDPAIRDLSHWKGHGRFADQARWRAIGEKHLRLARRLTRLAGRDAPILRVAEWGPGGGSNAVAFAPSVERFVGVDISRPNLDECASRLAEVAFGGFLPLCIEAGNPESVAALVPEPCDLFLSTAVFQHFPSRDYGVRVMRVAAGLLGPQGVGLVQIRYDDGNPSYRSRRRDYERNAIAFTSYRVDEFWRIAQGAGFEPLAVTLEPDVNYAYYFLLRRAR